MLFITPTSGVKGAKDYFTRQLAAGDYYLRDGSEFPGQWHGLGAGFLGLAGAITQKDFFALCENRDPVTGERLTARTKEGRRIYYDYTFDAPKGVTLAYELGGDDRILDAFRSAVADTMGDMESDIEARVRKGGADGDRRTANVIWGEFIHRTTRPVDGLPDPQLHCHAVVFNATFDTEEERWKAAQFGALVRDKLYYQASFHARLASRLEALGYRVRRDGTSFALVGVERDLTRKFSRRSDAIDEAAQRLGIVDAEAKAGLGRLTREPKGQGQSIHMLRAQWAGKLSDADREALAQAGRHAPRSAPPSEAAGAVDFAVAKCFERASVVSERELLAQSLMHGVGRVQVEGVQRAAAAAPLLRHVVGGQVLATTREVHGEELAVVAFAREGRGQCKPLGPARTMDVGAGLSDEQHRAALHLLGSRDRVTGLRGGAGTGKTRLMQSVVAAIECGGKQVYTFAPSAKASRGVLRDEGFASADTVERLLTDRDLQRGVRGQVLWIDEAGLLSLRDTRRLFELAQREDCRVVVSGDAAQHAAVARGDVLRLLESEAGLPFAQLREIRRQRPAAYREAVSDIASGAAPGADARVLVRGLERLDRMGAVQEIAGAERFQRLASDYVEAVQMQGNRVRTALVVAPTHREGEQVATAIREALKQRGRIHGAERSFLRLKGLGLTEAERGSADSYRPGEVVRFHQNAPGFVRGERVTVTAVGLGAVHVLHADGRAAALPLRLASRFEVYEAKRLALAAGDRLRVTINGYTREALRGGKPAKSRLSNGDVFEVAGFTRGGDIRLSNGFVVPRDYGGIAQGYVVTSHAAQGSTVDTVLVALGAESLAAASRQQLYVSVSRGRDAVRLYTDDKRAMLEAVQADAARLSAIELLKGKTPSRPRPSDDGLIRMRRRAMAYDDVRMRAMAPVWQATAAGGREVWHGRS